MRTRLTTIALCCALAACTSTPTRDDAQLFATARVVTDFESYDLHRVGLLPLVGQEVWSEQSEPVQSGFLGELSRTTPFEVVYLAHADLAPAALLVLANKQDVQGAMTAAEMTEALGLTAIRSHPWHLEPCCALTGEGCNEGMDWVAQAIASR